MTLHSLNRHTIVSIIGFILSVLSISGLWFQFESSQNRLYTNLLEQGEERAIQLSDTVGQQVESVFENINFVLLELRYHWFEGSKYYENESHKILSRFPKYAINQLSINDASALVIFSSKYRNNNKRYVKSESLKYFVENSGDRLHVGSPVYSNITNQWAIPISRPLIKNQQYLGIVQIEISPHFFSSLLDRAKTSGHDVLELLDFEGSFLSQNTQLEKVLGHKVNPGHPFLSLNSPDSGVLYAPAKIDNVEKIFGWKKLNQYGVIIVAGLGKEHLLIPYHKQRGDALRLNVLATILIIIFFLWIFVLMQNLSRRQEELLKSEASLNEAQKIAQIGHWELDPVNNQLHWSDEIFRIFGVDPNQFGATYESFLETIHPDDRQIVQDAYDESVKKQTPYGIKHRILRQDNNELRWVIERGKHEFNSKGELILTTGTVQDDTARTELDIALQDYQARFQEVVATVPGAILQYIQNIEGEDRLVYMSDSSSDIFEISPSEAMNDLSQLWSMVFEDEIDGLMKSFRQSAESMGSWEYEWRIKTPSGKVKWLSGKGKPVREAANSVKWNIIITDETKEHINKKILDSFFEQNINMNLIVDFEGTILRANNTWEMQLGYSMNDFIGKKFIDFVHPDDVESTLAESKNIVDSGKSTIKFENRYRHANGSYRLISWSSRISTDLEMIFAIANDITEARISEIKMQQAATVFSSTAEGVIIVDLNNNIIEVNKAFTEITGYSKEDVLGKKPSILTSGKHNAEFYNEMWQSIKETGNWSGEIWNRRKNDGIYPELLTISTIKDDKNEPVGYVGVFSDISTLKEHQERLDHIAHHDPLTGLPNRLLFNSRLQQSILHAKRLNSLLAVIFIDLDRFKNVNDSLGHIAGDELLIDVAKRLSNAVRETDTVARVSGDEFVILLEDIHNSNAAAVIVEKILNIFERPFQILETEISITASMGLSMYPEDADNAEALMANADAAMYRAKDSGRNTFMFYSSEFTDQAAEYVFLENALQKALENDELFIVFQPQIDILHKKIIGMETLLRWQHPKRGLISPGHFIPVAEQSGIIRKIGKWVLLQACIQGKKWLDAGLSVGRIAVNVAGPQFHMDSFVEDVCEVLECTGFNPENLEIEVTESFVMKQVDNTIDKLDALRQIGIKVSIDDFGTGYSSLSYLKKLPIDKLKVDQSFVRDIPADKDAISIAISVVALAKALGLSVIAEGIETKEQLDFFRELNCEGQGYLISKPLEVSDMEMYLKEGSKP